MPDISQSSRFLQLPAELRNNVYEYVLTSPHALRSRKPTNGEHLPHGSDPSTSSSKVLEPSADEFNQIKYVNKEIYKEANALELRYNTLRFAYRPEDGSLASAQLISFMSSLPAPQKSWLRTIVVDDRNSEHDNHSDAFKAFAPLDKPQIIAMLGQICSQNPKILVRYTMTYWSTTTVTGVPNNPFKLPAMTFFILRGVGLAHALFPQDGSLSLMMPGHGPAVNFYESLARHGATWRYDVPISSFQAPNLRFVPAEGVIWDEQAWRDWAKHTGLFNVNIEAVIKQVKMWIEEGI